VPNFIKRKHPRKGEKKNQSARTRVQADKRPQRGEANGGKETTEYGNLHWSHEAYQLKKGDVKLIKI
jgi:hypothetical protein